MIIIASYNNHLYIVNDKLMLDILIENALIVDGSGNPGYKADVGIENNKIKIFRYKNHSMKSKQKINAEGLILSPGFIDFHAHSGLRILDEPLHEPKIMQGITTELIGVDGNSYAPFKSKNDLNEFIELNSGLDGTIQQDVFWPTVDSYLNAFHKKTAVNIAYLVGNSVLRINTVGWNNKLAKKNDIENMQSILRESMEEGAFGLSTGLEYPPGNFADTSELIELSKQAYKLGGIYHTHVRYELGDKFLDPFREAIEIGNKSNVPVHITHLYQSSYSKGGAHKILNLVESSRESGMDITFDSYPYIYGSTRLIIMLPDWTKDGGTKTLKDILSSDEMREKLKKEVSPRALSWDQVWLTYFKLAKNHRYEGLSVAEIARSRNQNPIDTICDILLEEDLQTCYVALGSNGSTIPKFINHPLSMVGSDAVLLGDFPSPRTYGCFPTIISEYVREEKFMSLEFAIRKITSFPAQRLGIRDRGLIKEDFKADITLFDLNKIKSKATKDNPKVYAEGIEYVIVNGKIAINKGQHTKSLNGYALKSNY